MKYKKVKDENGKTHNIPDLPLEHVEGMIKALEDLRLLGYRDLLDDDGNVLGPIEAFIIYLERYFPVDRTRVAQQPGIIGKIQEQGGPPVDSLAD